MKLLLMLVEDREATARALRRSLEKHGVSVVVAANRDHAYRLIRSMPSIDGLICDINLNPGDDNDEAGYEVAAKARSERPELPIVGYSSEIEESEFPSFRARSREKNPVFNFMYPKGKWTKPQFDSLMRREWLPSMEGYFRARVNNTDRISSTLDAFDPVADVCAPLKEKVGSPKGSTISSVLEGLGISLLTVDNSDLKDRFGATKHRLMHPLLIWIRKTGSRTYAEVHKFPEFSVNGKTEDEAIFNLITLIDAVNRRKSLKPDGRRLTFDTEAKNFAKHLLSSKRQKNA